MRVNCGLLQSETLNFAGLRLRQGVDELDRARIFVRRDRRLHMILQPLDAIGIADDAGLEHDVRFDDLSALDIGRADHRAFGDIGMREQRRFDLRTGDVVAGGHDHVVGARGEMEHAVGIAA